MTSIHHGRTLLPANRTRFETALSLTSAEFREIDADAVRRAFDPYRCPAQLLPWLAHAFSLDFWNRDWSEARMRRVVGRAVRLHFIKGTLAGAREYVELADARLVGAIVPPSTIHSGPSLTRAEREAWLSQLPQVRVWRIKEPGFRRHGLFVGGWLFKGFLERGFNRPSDAASRRRRRARYVVGGVEQDTRVTEFEGFFRLHNPGRIRSAVASGLPLGRRFFTPSSARGRLVTVAPAMRAPWRFALGPTLEPVTAEPDRVRVPGTRERRVFAGTATGSGFFQPNETWRRIFDRYAIHDRRRVGRRPACQFMGVGRYGFPAHTAHLRVSVPGRRSRYAAGEGLFVPRSTFWLPRDPRRVADVRRALVAGKRASDRLFLRFARRPGIVAGQPFRAGVDSFVIGRPSAA